MMSNPLKRDYKWIRRKTRKEREKNTRKHWEKCWEEYRENMGNRGRHKERR